MDNESHVERDIDQMYLVVQELKDINEDGSLHIVDKVSHIYDQVMI